MGFVLLDYKTCVVNKTLRYINLALFLQRYTFFSAMQNRVIQKISLVSKSLPVEWLSCVNTLYSAGISKVNAFADGTAPTKHPSANK